MRTRLERAIDKRDDAEQNLDRWGFGMRVSEIRAAERRIKKLREKVARLEAKRGTDQ